MRNLLFGIQLAVSVFLIAVILIQQKGTGLGSSFGGTGQIYRSKRGLEKGLFTTTIVLGALFVITALLNLIINK